MLCQQCQLKEATVHFAAVVWPSGEETKDLCETCYSTVEAERIASHSPKQKPLPVLDVERITALEYLDFAAKADGNSADAAAYRHVKKELERFPATRARLGTEMLRMALEKLQKEKDATQLINIGSFFRRSGSNTESDEWIDVLSEIVRCSFRLMAQAENNPSNHAFGLGLTIAAYTLRQTDPRRFYVLMVDLKAQHRNSPSVRTVIDYIEDWMAKSDQRRSKLRALRTKLRL